MYDVIVRTERLGTDSGPALNINRAAATIDTVVMFGNHTGLIWNGDNNGNFPSSLSNAQLSGSTCLLLVEHTYISGSDNVITPQCSGTITLQDSQVNWSKFTDTTQSTIINLDSFSTHCTGRCQHCALRRDRGGLGCFCVGTKQQLQRNTRCTGANFL